MTDFGLALGYDVFLTYGIGPVPGPPIIFDSKGEMLAAGISSKFQEPSQVDLNSLNACEVKLLANLRTAMVAFAFTVYSNGAKQYMKSDNTSRFRNGLGPSVMRAMVSVGLMKTVEDAQSSLVSYMATLDAVSCPAVLNVQNPGSNDFLEHFIIQGAQKSQISGGYGFARDENGFGALAVALAQESLKSILGAARQHEW